MLVAIMNKTLIKPAPTLSSKAPAKGASKIKKIIDKKTLPRPMAVMITINRLAISTMIEVKTKLKVNNNIANAAGDTRKPPINMLKTSKLIIPFTIPQVF